MSHKHNMAIKESSEIQGAQESMQAHRNMQDHQQTSQHDSARADQMHARRQPSSHHRKRALLPVLASSAAVLTLVSACGQEAAVPMNDEFTSQSSQAPGTQAPNTQAQGSQSQGGQASNSQAPSGQPESANQPGQTGQQNQSTQYADGTYNTTSTYGPIKEDSIDVHLTLRNNLVEHVEVVGHAFTPVSKKHQAAFSSSIAGVVQGKPIADLHVDVVAGASWTSEAFNKALDTIRQESAVAQH